MTRKVPSLLTGHLNSWTAIVFTRQRFHEGAFKEDINSMLANLLFMLTHVKDILSRESR